MLLTFVLRREYVQGQRIRKERGKEQNRSGTPQATMVLDRSQLASSC